MRITAASIRDFKRLRTIVIKPAADRAAILIAGKNAQGKTSVLDALTSAFGGKRQQPPDPVRHGAEKADIRIELDGGELVIHRAIAPSGDSVLEVRDRNGAVRAPQAMLDRLIGERFLDPLSFLKLAAKDQRGVLLKLIDKDGRIADLDQKRERCFNKRTEVGRSVTHAEGELARLPDPVEVQAPLDVGALAEERARLAEVQRKTEEVGHEAIRVSNLRMAAANERVGVEHAIADAQEQIRQLEARIEDLKLKLGGKMRTEKDLREQEVEHQERLGDANKHWAELAPRLAEVDASLARANAHNRAVFEAQAANERRAAAEKTVQTYQAGYDELTRTLDKIDERKLKILAAAELPVENLGVDPDGLVLNGVPFQNASGSEQLRVSLAIATASSPGLDDIWIRDGSLLDDDSLGMAVRHAEKNGKRLWIERVGIDDDGAIVIQDGQAIDG